MMQASVLIVDDELLVRQTLSEWMRKKNFHVIEADGGQQAMDIIRRENLDIVICDVVMSGMNGIELLRQSKAVKANLPFIMISGYLSHSTLMNVLKLGASDYLRKPFTLEELTRHVGYTIKLKALSRPLAPVLRP